MRPTVITAPRRRAVSRTVVRAAPRVRAQVDEPGETAEGSLGVLKYYRVALANWPDPWRLRWGQRANELQDKGMSWRDAEVQAFIEVWNERAVGKPLPMM